MATIFDVASEAGVSTAAVSLVLNDPATNRVGAEKRKQIVRVARRLGYSPNLLAKALAKRSTGVVGLLVPMRDPIFFNHFVAEVLSGIQSCLIDRGYHLMIYSHAARRGKITRTQIAQSRLVDGLMIFNTRLCSDQDMADTIRDLRAASTPFVMLNAYYGHEAINYVGVDDREIGHMAGRYLASKGHTRIAMIAGARRASITAPLVEGFRRALADAGLRWSDRLLAFGEYSHDNVLRLAKEWLGRSKPPTAVFCADDQMAPDLYEALESQGRAIPRDVAVLGRGNLMFTAHLTPKLTTIRIPTFDMGRSAAELLLASLSDKSAQPQRVLLPTSLIERASV